MVPFTYTPDPLICKDKPCKSCLVCLRADGYRIVALEQSPSSIILRDYIAPSKLVLVLGEEVHGVPPELLQQCDDTIEIPMHGQKESFNVSVAAAIALYELSQ